MDKTELIARLKPIIALYTEVSTDGISETTDFINDLKVNSANLVDIVLDVEQEFDIEIDNPSMEKMLSVGAAMEIVETKLKEK